MVYTTKVSLEVLEKIHEKQSTLRSNYGLIYIDKSINWTSPNLLLEIKKQRGRHPNKSLIGNFIINPFPNKFKQLKDVVIQYTDILVLTKIKLSDTFLRRNS